MTMKTGQYFILVIAIVTTFFIGGCGNKSGAWGAQLGAENFIRSRLPRNADVTFYNTKTFTQDGRFVIVGSYKFTNTQGPAQDSYQAECVKREGKWHIVRIEFAGQVYSDALEKSEWTSQR